MIPPAKWEFRTCDLVSDNKAGWGISRLLDDCISMCPLCCRCDVWV